VVRLIISPLFYKWGHRDLGRFIWWMNYLLGNIKLGQSDSRAYTLHYTYTEHWKHSGNLQWCQRTYFKNKSKNSRCVRILLLSPGGCSHVTSLGLGSSEALRLDERHPSSWCHQLTEQQQGSGNSQCATKWLHVPWDYKGTEVPFKRT
jgi:hypothetical protein